MYERKGATALIDKARGILGARDLPPVSAPPEVAPVELDNACVRAGSRLIDAVNREAWDEVNQLLAPSVSVESRRKIVGFQRIDVPSSQWPQDMRRYLETGMVRYRHTALAFRGDRLALMRLEMGTTDLSSGAPRDEMLQVVGLDEEGRIALQVKFDVEDIDVATAELEAVYARFEAERPAVRRLENTAARVFDHVWSHFAARDWDALADTVADNYVGIDHRRVVSAETQYGRDQVVRDLQAAAEVGFTISMVSAVAIRGGRLVLARVRAAGRDPDAIQNDALNIVEIDADDRIANVVTYDVEDIDAAIAELDARYLAGEAAPYAHTWSVIAGAYAALNRHEIAATAPDFASVDHRRGTKFAPGDLIAYVRATWDLAQDGSTYVEAVHRLNNLGAVVTHVTRGSSQEGFDAEWREVFLLTVEGDLLSRCELFDEADLDAAVTRFDQLSRPAPRLENTATRVFERLYSYVAVGDWHAVAQITADNVSVDDRRRVVNAGVLHGRDANIKDAQATADVGFTMTMVGAIATRGERLALLRVRVSGRDPEAIQNDALNIVEIDADERIVGDVVFDLEDFDSAIAELDARYIVGEAAPYAHTWAVIMAGHDALNRHELPPMTSDCVSIDHRRAAAFGPGEITEYFRAGRDLGQDIHTYVEVVHRLSELGAVCTHVGHGVSREGFEAEWRGIDLLTVDGDMVNRGEVFDEADLDTAIARFDQLNRNTPQLENAASQAAERYMAHFAARYWDELTKVLAADIVVDDRRRAVNAGIRHGRDAEIANLRAAADVGITYFTSDVIAARGERLILARVSGGIRGPGDFLNDVLGVVEINSHNEIAAIVVFDPDDFDAAIAELDTRYLAGEAGVHPHMWTATLVAYAAINRRELPATTTDFISKDHRRGAAFAPGDMIEYLRAGWDLDHEIYFYPEAVHRLSDLGVVVTHKGRGASREGFDAEWREVMLFTVNGNSFNRCEVFDERDLDTALARFDQLSRPVPRLENAASRVYDRVAAYFAARDWDATANAMAQSMIDDDRRRMVNAGIRRGRDVEVANSQATAAIGGEKIMSTVIATRGERLALCRSSIVGRGEQSGAFRIEFLSVIEIDADERLAAHVGFDLDDFDAALAELDARYLAGEAAAHAHTWSLVAASIAALNRREHPATTPDWVNIDHRRGISFAPGEVSALLANWNATPDLSNSIESVHRLNHLGAVVTSVTHETSQEGFEAEWRGISVLTIEGDLIDRLEVFDEADIDAALARFEELKPSDTATGKRGKPSDPALPGAVSGRRLGGHLADPGR